MDGMYIPPTGLRHCRHSGKKQGGRQGNVGERWQDVVSRMPSALQLGAHMARLCFLEQSGKGMYTNQMPGCHAISDARMVYQGKEKPNKDGNTRALTHTHMHTHLNASD
eukprot:scaffold104160_cov24-Tisochrysis_lutea.AAC.1